jgi:hypothetical protein
MNEMKSVTEIFDYRLQEEEKKQPKQRQRKSEEHPHMNHCVDYGAIIRRIEKERESARKFAKDIGLKITIFERGRNIQIQEVQSPKTESKNTTLRFIVKLSKAKRILKVE